MKYLAGLIIGIAVLFVSVIAIIAIRSGDSNDKTTEVQVVNLVDYVTKNSEVRVDIRGPIVADEEFQSMSMSITPSTRKLTIYKGYNRAVVSEVNLPNNQASYTSFMNALSRVGYTNNRTSKNADSVGVCSDGNIYTFDLLDNGNSVNKNWASTCDEKDGTFKGNITDVTELFESQFPNYSEDTSELRI